MSKLGNAARGLGKFVTRDAKGLFKDASGMNAARADQFDAHNKPEGQQGKRGRNFNGETPFIGTHWFEKK